MRGKLLAWGWGRTGGVLAGLAGLCLGCGRAPLSRFGSAEQLVDSLREKTSCSRAVSGEAKVFFRGDGRRLSGSVLYLAGAPDRLRFDVISPFGATLTSLTSDGSRFSLFDLSEKRFYVGPAKTCNVKRFTRVPVPPMVLVETLRGRPATVVHDPSLSQLRFKSPLLATPHYEAELVGSDEVRQLVKIAVHPDDLDAPLERQRLRYLGAELWQGGALSYSVQLSQYQPAHLRPAAASEDPLDQGLPPSGPSCDAELPGKVRFVVPSTNYEVTFSHTEQWHNPPLPEAAFELVAPSGVETVFSDCRD